MGVCCHSNQTRTPIANLPNNAQLYGISYHSPSYIHAVVCNCGKGQTDTQTAVTTIHFASLRRMQNVNGMLFTCVQGVYVTYIYKGGPAHQSGLHVHDKILQV